MCDPQLDHSLTSMEWLSRLSVNKQILNIDHSEFKLENKIDSKYSTPITVSYTFAQRAEPNRPIDLNAEYKGSEHGRREGKPPYSYVNLITFAINSTTKKRMTLNEIYEWIADNFNYYKNAGSGWKNSIRHNLSLNKCFRRVQRTKDDPGKGSYWTIDNNYQEVALNTPVKIKQKIDQSSTSSDSPQTNFIYSSPSMSPNINSQNDQILPGSSETTPYPKENISFVDNSPIFDDLSASFKKLFKSVVTNKDMIASGLTNSNKTELDETKTEEDIPSTNEIEKNTGTFSEPTLNSINTLDFNKSFDNFVENVKLASTGEVNWNEIDTSQFKNLVESIRNVEKNNWNLSTNQFNYLACSLSNFLANSGLMSKNKLNELHNNLSRNIDARKESPVLFKDTDKMEDLLGSSKLNMFVPSELSNEENLTKAEEDIVDKSKMEENDSNDDSLSLLRNSLCSFSFLNHIDLNHENVQIQQKDSFGFQHQYNSNNSNPLLSGSSFNECEDNEFNWDNLL
ncbi:unnamed protein product [Brachionus calyciflorus]|uniref:Fork-head domain-containing protein n=1 Tax=Brachionus calyciflorus TaxID=104777 RepID=A0A814GVP7_9BILA|nr:unnamed protein product [Brachionus calyciflorus]